MELILIASIAFTASLISGIVGLGGAVILIPAYLYLPELLGVQSLDVKMISGLTSVQVFCSSLFGMMVHRKRGAVNKRLVLTMGIPITAASLIGALFSKSVEPQIIILIFALMAITGAVFVFFKEESGEQELPENIRFNVPGAVAIALVVGFFGGIVGAPGAFILSPLIMTLLNIPTRVTIGSTLGIVLVSAFAASVGKFTAGLVPYPQTVVAVIAAIPGVYIGSKLSHFLPTKILRWALAVIIAGVGVQMLWKVML
jgi:uncharacterized membrane protein YfcA